MVRMLPFRGDLDEFSCMHFDATRYEDSLRYPDWHALWPDVNFDLLEEAVWQSVQGSDR